MEILKIYGIALTLLCGVAAQFPRDCTTENALRARECCPELVASTGISSKCGEEQGRGVCEDIDILPSDNLDRETVFALSLDERKMWPTMFYDRACKCHGNFDGINCGKCKPGYSGTTCETVKPLLVRKNILNMPSDEVQEFVDILDKSKHTNSERYVILNSTYDQILAGAKPEFLNISVYDLFVWMHYYVARNNLVPSDFKLVEDAGNIQLASLLNFDLEINDEQDYAHEGPAFLPWHRYFLLKWEEEVAELVGNPKFTIPYWDWRDSETCEVCTNQLFGARSNLDVNLISSDSVFSKWQVICTKDDEYILNGKQCDGTPEGPLLRNYGAFDPTVTSGIPTTEDVQSSLRFSAYETFPYNKVAHGSFRNIMEGFADPKSGEATSGFSTMHNAVHLYMNGTMSEVGSSANDPIFILHHAFIDSVYERWLQGQSRQQLFLALDGPRSNVSVGHNLQDFMVPFFPLVRQIEGFQTTAELGFEYEYIANSVEGSGNLENVVIVDQNLGDNKIDPMPQNVLDFIFEESVIQTRQNIVSEGNFEALTVEGMLSSVTRMSIVKRISRVRPLKKKKINFRSHKTHSPWHHHGEGGFLNSFRHQQESIQTQPLSQTQEKNRGVDVGIELNSTWNRFVSFVYDWQKIFTNMSINDQIVFFFVFGVSIFCIFLLILIICCSCRTRQMEERNVKKGNLCCNRLRRGSAYDYDDEESQCLLENTDKKLTCKAVMSRSYTYESDENCSKKHLEYKEI